MGLSIVVSKNDAVAIISTLERVIIYKNGKLFASTSDLRITPLSIMCDNDNNKTNTQEGVVREPIWYASIDSIKTQILIGLLKGHGCITLDRWVRQ